MQSDFIGYLNTRLQYQKVEYILDNLCRSAICSSLCNMRLLLFFGCSLKSQKERVINDLVSETPKAKCSVSLSLL